MFAATRLAALAAFSTALCTAALLAPAAAAPSFDETKDWIVDQLTDQVKQERAPLQAPYPVARNGVDWEHTVYSFSGCTLTRIAYTVNARAVSHRCGDGCATYTLEDRYTLDIDTVPLASITALSADDSANFKINTYEDAVKHYEFTAEKTRAADDYSYRNGMWARTDPFGLCRSLPKEKQKLSASCNLAAAPAAMDRLQPNLRNGRPAKRKYLYIPTWQRKGAEEDMTRRFDAAFKNLAAQAAKKGCKVEKPLF